MPRTEDSQAGRAGWTSRVERAGKSQLGGGAATERCSYQRRSTGKPGLPLGSWSDQCQVRRKAPTLRLRRRHGRVQGRHSSGQTAAAASRLRFPQATASVATRAMPQADRGWRGSRHKDSSRCVATRLRRLPVKEADALSHKALHTPTVAKSRCRGTSMCPAASDRAE